MAKNNSINAKAIPVKSHRALLRSARLQRLPDWAIQAGITQMNTDILK
jgi:hypothetical protein